MKKWLCVLMVLVLTVCLLTSCDPVLPVNPDTGEASTVQVVCTPNPLPVGQTAELTLKYPDTADTPIVGWETPVVTVLEGKELVSVDGLQITAHQAGTVTIQVETKAMCEFMGMVIDRVTYQTEVEIVIVP